MILVPFLEKCEALLMSFAHSLGIWVGSWSFIFWHTFIFLMWKPIGLNPNTLLVAINIEAIYLMCILLMSQNRSDLKAQEEELGRYKYVINMISFNKSIEEKIYKIAEDLAETDKRVEKQLEILKTKRGIFL